MTDEYCDHCGQRMGYRSAVSKGLVRMLETIADAIEEKGVNVLNVKKELVDTGKLTVNQYTNKSHLVRLGLLFCVEGEVGNFGLTSKAMGFLKGERIPREAVVEKATKDRGSRTVETSEETCTIHDFMEKGEYWIVPGFDIREGRVIKAQA